MKVKDLIDVFSYWRLYLLSVIFFIRIFSFLLKIKNSLSLLYPCWMVEEDSAAFHCKNRRIWAQKISRNKINLLSDENVILFTWKMMWWRIDVFKDHKKKLLLILFNFCRRKGKTCKNAANSLPGPLEHEISPKTRHNENEEMCQSLNNDEFERLKFSRVFMIREGLQFTMKIIMYREKKNENFPMKIRHYKKGKNRKMSEMKNLWWFVITMRFFTCH